LRQRQGLLNGQDAKLLAFWADHPNFPYPDHFVDPLGSLDGFPLLSSC
jgi:hypothetical protein